MNQTIRSMSALAIIFAFALAAASSPEKTHKTIMPPQGKIIHGIYPGGRSGEEDDLTLADLRSYEQCVGHKAAWVYFSHNWYRDRNFPRQTANWIRDAGSVPFIRLMLRSKNHQSGKAERQFSLQAIAAGKFDDDLKKWAAAAKAFASPLIVEYGTEVNGDWFGWNGRFFGGAKTGNFGDPAKAEGPQRFVAAYRHIVQTMRQAGADNITWVFHLDVAQSPDAAWNRFENYYPGDDVVDWIGVSCYGPQRPTRLDDIASFRQRFDPVYPRIVKMAPTKPIMILEFGCTAGHPKVQAATWAEEALDDLLGKRWPAVAGFSWWNERWENDDNPKHNTTMRVQDTPELGQVFRSKLEKAGDKVVGKIKDR